MFVPRRVAYRGRLRGWQGIGSQPIANAVGSKCDPCGSRSCIECVGCEELVAGTIALVPPSRSARPTSPAGPVAVFTVSSRARKLVYSTYWPPPAKMHSYSISGVPHFVPPPDVLHIIILLPAGSVFIVDRLRSCTSHPVSPPTTLLLRLICTY
ncbi:hypothetical protein BD413DRAFT_318072 [Trametes elegans]|nr:hypothetical protein BD413DRAFT_318072 [Trametes elegans]